MDDVTDAVEALLSGVLDDDEMEIRGGRDVGVVARLLGSSLAVVDAGGIEVVAGIDVGLGDRVIGRAFDRRPGARSVTGMAGVQSRFAAFGSVTVTLWSVTLPVLVAVIV